MQTLSFNERAKALENQFFQQVDQELLETIRHDLTEHDAKAALHSASGIRSDEVLVELVRVGVQPETLAAVSLIPLVALAWTDGKVTDSEREKVMATEKEAGIAEDSPSHRLLCHWLDRNPGEELFETWQHFVHELRGRVSPDVFPLLDKDLVKRAESVAKASGGYWSYGSVSPKQYKLLAEVKKTLRAAHPA